MKNIFKKVIIQATCIALFLPLVSMAEGQAQGNSGANSSVNQKAKKIFQSDNDKIDKSGKCSWECRDVNSGYVTQISGFDFKGARTFCKVFEATNLNQDLGIDAGKINPACKIQDFKAEYEQLKNGGKNNVNTKSSIEFRQDEKNITMTKFLTALVTLNPNIIDRAATNSLGEITLKDGIQPLSIMNYTKNYQYEGHKEHLKEEASALATIARWVFPDSLVDYHEEAAYSAIDEIPAIPTNVSSYENTSALDGFNKNNMAYFSDLFLANEKIYQHLQIFLFMLVGGFFVTQIGASKLQAYLENRGESSGKQPYLHKFYIPLIMVGTFFMPIPEANGMAHSTIMQNMIRYFTIHSTNLADMANAIGAKTYMDKIYKSLGGMSNEGILTTLGNKALNDFVIKEGNAIYQKTCMERYEEKLGSYNTSSINFLTLSDEEKAEFRKNYTQNDPNGKAGTKEDISFEACISLEVQIREAERKNARLITQIEGIKKFQGKGGAATKINELDKYFAQRDKQLGWIDSILIPSSAILAETFVFADDQVIKDDIKEATQSNIKNTQAAIKGGDLSAGEDDISDSATGWLAGQLVWMMLPGAGAIKDFVMDNSSIVFTAVGAAIGSLGTGVIGLITGAIGFIISTFGDTLAGYAAAIVLMQWTFEKIPLLVCTTASLVAFVSYLVSLCKYFYVSPFVVAWGMATRQMNKIVEFLISGIAIFLKPVLIVLFIYLALFIHTLIDELFVFLAVEQFSGIETSWYNFYTNFITGAITGLLVMFGKLASAYIMWKLIVSGASWTLSLVGIDGKQDEMIASGIESNLARRAFVA